jgi:hypothetical protein
VEKSVFCFDLDVLGTHASCTSKNSSQRHHENFSPDIYSNYLLVIDIIFHFSHGIHRFQLYSTVATAQEQLRQRV